MKKISIVICYMLLLTLLLIGCKKSVFELSIQTNVDSYVITSSSIQGITMTPKVKTNDKNIETEYSWATTGGTLIESGDSVTWNPISEKSKTLPSTVTISLIAKQKNTTKILAKTNLIIEWTDSACYSVKK